MSYVNAPLWFVVVSGAVLLGLILHQLMSRKGEPMKQEDTGSSDESLP